MQKLDKHFNEILLEEGAISAINAVIRSSDINRKFVNEDQLHFIIDNCSFNINDTDSWGTSPLLATACTDNVKAFRIIKNIKGFDINSKLKMNLTNAFIYCVKNRKLKVLKEICTFPEAIKDFANNSFFTIMLSTMNLKDKETYEYLLKVCPAEAMAQTDKNNHNIIFHLKSHGLDDWIDITRERMIIPDELNTNDYCQAISDKYSYLLDKLGITREELDNISSEPSGKRFNQLVNLAIGKESSAIKLPNVA